MFGLKEHQLKYLEHLGEVIVQSDGEMIRCVKSKYGQYYCEIAGVKNKIILFYVDEEYRMRLDIGRKIYNCKVGNSDKLLNDICIIAGLIDDITSKDQLDAYDLECYNITVSPDRTI